MMLKSKYFWIPFFAVGLVTGGWGSAFYYTAVHSVEKGIKTRLKSSAALVACAVDAGPFESLRGPEDVSTPAYEEALKLLRDFKATTEDIAFLYVMRLDGGRSFSSWIPMIRKNRPCPERSTRRM